jgi:hypothetical protein
MFDSGISLPDLLEFDLGAVNRQAVTSEAYAVTARPEAEAGNEKIADGTRGNQTITVCGGVVQLVRTPACHTEAAGSSPAPGNSSKRYRI